jgi:integrase
MGKYETAPKGRFPMSLQKRGKYFHYDFWFGGKRYQGSTGQTSKLKAVAEEGRIRERIESASDFERTLEKEARAQRRRTVEQAADDYFTEYKARHQSAAFARYALGHLKRLLGKLLLGEVTPTVVKTYQNNRLAEKAGPKSINEEVQFLLRLCGEQGDWIRGQLKREKALKLKTPPSPGRAFTAEEKTRMLEAARHVVRSPQIYPALMLALNAGLRDKELRKLRWQQIDLINQKTLAVGQSKSEAGTGRIVPLNGLLLAALEAHAAWYARAFGECRPEWFVFARGRLPSDPERAQRLRSPDPTRPVTSFKTAWTNIRKAAKVQGRWHDNRHTLVTELAESGAGDEVIMQIAGHVSRAMLARYSHIRIEAKRRALEAIAARQQAAEKRAAEKPAAEQKQKTSTSGAQQKLQ